MPKRARKRGAGRTDRQSSLGLPNLTAPGRFAEIFVTVFFLFQLLLPLRYYLNRPTSDERFAWRMFSYTSRRRCDSSVWDHVQRDGRIVPRRLNKSDVDYIRWRNLMERERPSVIENFLRYRLDQPGVKSASLTLRCTDLAGDASSTLTYSIDSDGRMDKTTGPAP